MCINSTFHSYAFALLSSHSRTVNPFTLWILSDYFCSLKRPVCVEWFISTSFSSFHFICVQLSLQLSQETIKCCFLHTPESRRSRVSEDEDPPRSLFCRTFAAIVFITNQPRCFINANVAIEATPSLPFNELRMFQRLKIYPFTSISSRTPVAGHRRQCVKFERNNLKPFSRNIYDCESWHCFFVFAFSTNSISLVTADLNKKRLFMQITQAKLGWR